MPMKIGGVAIEGDLCAPNEDVLVLPRRKSQIVFTARALPDMSDFEDRVPAPKPPRFFKKGKGWSSNLDDPTYRQQADDYGKLRIAYIVLWSLQDVEWETIKDDKPSTWLNWEDELKKNGFSQHECNLVLHLCFQVNQLDEAKLEQARALFVLGQEQAAKESSSQNTEQKNSPSGTPASDSE